MPTESITRRRTANRVLWTIQGLLALLFLFTGITKLVLPAAALEGPVHFPTAFLRFIGVCEALGAIGLVVPSLLRILPVLTPLAACGLAIITTGATVVTLMGGLFSMAPLPFVAALLAAWVAYGRTRIAPIAAKAGRSTPGQGGRTLAA